MAGRDASKGAHFRAIFVICVLRPIYLFNEIPIAWTRSQVRIFRDSVMNGASPTSERRLARRFLQNWRERRGDRKFPSLADIDPEAIGDMSPSCFILDTVSKPEFPYFRYLGSDLLKYSGIFLSGAANGIVRHDVVGRSDTPASDVSSPTKGV